MILKKYAPLTPLIPVQTRRYSRQCFATGLPPSSRSKAAAIPWVLLGYFICTALILAGGKTNAVEAGTQGLPDKVEFGRALFFDKNLSLRRNQACASCHDPAQGFIDSRDNGVAGAASLGDDGMSLGDRNASTVSYAALSPEFDQTPKGDYLGGQFHDGRAATLADQALKPPLNPIEMALPDSQALVARLLENTVYKATLTNLFGRNTAGCEACVLQAFADSISAFEQTDYLAPFDSRYDRYLAGRYRMTPLEEQGRILFFSPLTNCSACHLLVTSTLSVREPFSNYQYRNIGLPSNTLLRRKNGVPLTHQDLGLYENPAVDDREMRGKFKVPSLRNVAVTAPYMHNGVFQELATAIQFYNQYTVETASSDMNPETGQPWGPPEVPETIDLKLLKQGQPLDKTRIKALEAFLRTLTDRRYEALLSPL